MGIDRRSFEPRRRGGSKVDGGEENRHDGGLGRSDGSRSHCDQPRFFPALFYRLLMGWAWVGPW